MASNTFTDPVFGELTWDSPGKSWIADVRLTPKHTVEVFLSDCGEQPEEAGLAVCRAAYDRVRRNECDYRLATAAALLGTYNEDWRQSDEEEETLESFAAKLLLATILLYAEGGAELYYEGGDRFFGGHSITTLLDGEGVVIDVSFQG